jgi:hypothetical protein
MTPFRIAALVLVSLLFACPVSAQPRVDGPQPDCLHLGVVYVGATVEASFAVRETGSDPKIKFDVVAPTFVKVLHKSTEVRQFGAQDKPIVWGSVEIGIDTTAAGEFRGEVTVTLGQTTAKLPVSVTVKERRRGLSRILIAGTPFEQWATNNGRQFQAWTELVKDSPLDVSYLLIHRGKPFLRDPDLEKDLDLEKFDCIFLSPEALVFATPEDVKRARQYAEKGGRVVVAANHFFQGSVERANEVLAGYGLQMRDEESGGQNGVTLRKDDLDPQLVKAGVQSLHFFRASPIAIMDAKKARTLVRAVGVGQTGDGFVVKAQARKGEVIAIGESLWWFWISQERAQGSDNAKLLRWLLSRGT